MAAAVTVAQHWRDQTRPAGLIAAQLPMSERAAWLAGALCSKPELQAPSCGSLAGQSDAYVNSNSLDATMIGRAPAMGMLP